MNLFHTFSRIFTHFHISTQLQTIPYNSTQSHTFSPYLTQFHTIPHYSTQFHLLPNIFTQFRTFPHNSYHFHTIPHVSTHFHTIPHVSTYFHTIPITYTQFHSVSLTSFMSSESSPHVESAELFRICLVRVSNESILTSLGSTELCSLVYLVWIDDALYLCLLYTLSTVYLPRWDRRSFLSRLDRRRSIPLPTVYLPR